MEEGGSGWMEPRVDAGSPPSPPPPGSDSMPQVLPTPPCLGFAWVTKTVARGRGRDVGGVSIHTYTWEIVVQKNWEDEHRRRIEKEGRARVDSPPPLQEGGNARPLGGGGREWGTCRPSRPSGLRPTTSRNSSAVVYRCPRSFAPSASRESLDSILGGGREVPNEIYSPLFAPKP